MNIKYKYIFYMPVFTIKAYILTTASNFSPSNFEKGPN